MSHTELNNIPGLLVFIDFEKAFDSVSWSFAYKVLNFFWFQKLYHQLDQNFEQ